MALDGKQSVTQVCKMMRVSQSALNRWRRQFLAEQQGITPTAPAISAEQREIQRRKMSSCVATMPYLKSVHLLAREVLKSCMVDLRREGISHAQLSRCFSLNRSTRHRFPFNQTEIQRLAKTSGRFCGKYCK